MISAKKIFFLGIILFVLQQNIQAAESNIGISLLNKAERALTGPADNDRRVIALMAIGAVLVVTGSCLTIIGGYRATAGKPQKEGDDSPLAQNIVTDAIARVSGFGTALLGILCTVGGSATIVLAKEAIFRLQSYMDKHRIDC